MYSFNLDYIFNVVYNILLAIRYAILFWILRISPADYLKDHQYDAWDGLRDRGWINLEKATSIGSDPNANVVYLGGSSGNDTLSWWDILKHNILGIGNNNVGSVTSGNTTNYGLNPNDINYAAQKVNNDPWFANLHLSIQNPILAFCADILSVFAFVVLLILIYSMFQWLTFVLGPVFESKEKKKKEKLLAKREEMNRYRELEKEKVVVDNGDITTIKKEAEIINSMPGGIPGLPIDESDLDSGEVSEIHEDENLLMNYKAKNKIPEKENQILKVNREDRSIRESDLVGKETAASSVNEERLNWYREKWNIVINYMESKEESLWRIGILEADNLLDDLLSDRGYMGLTMADKLKQANFNTIDLAWSAHKVRNRIAHDGTRFVLTDRIARNTLELYRSVFKEFKVFE